MATTFLVKQKTGFAPLFCRVRVHDPLNHDKYLVNKMVSTGIYVPAEKWRLNQAGTAFLSYFGPGGKGNKEYSKVMEIKSAIDRRLAAGEMLDSQQIQAIIAGVRDREAIERQRIAEAEAAQREAEKSRVTLEKYLSTYADRMAAGDKLTREGGKYAYRSRLSVRRSIKAFCGFLDWRGQGADFADITPKLMGEYERYLVGKDYAKGTIGALVKDVKAIVNAALAEGLHDNHSLAGYRATNKEQKDSIYLTESELDKIAAVEVFKYPDDFANPALADICRDVFLVGAYTGQRVSDYKAIPADSIKEIGGRKCLEFVQKKTGEPVIVPIATKLQAIFDKWGGVPPQVKYEQDINEQIKKVAKVAGITGEITTTITKGGRLVKETRRKCDIITTHTARRSFATNAYLGGLDLSSIADITGHKSAEQVKTYIRADKLERIRRVFDNPFFK